MTFTIMLIIVAVMAGLGCGFCVGCLYTKNRLKEVRKILRDTKRLKASVIISIEEQQARIERLRQFGEAEEVGLMIHRRFGTQKMN